MPVTYTSFPFDGKRVSELGVAAELTGLETIPGIQSGGSVKMLLRSMLDAPRTLTISPLQGTDSTTTAVLVYGINVVDTSSPTDFCARLPLVPKKGKTVTIINTSTFTARIFPSVPGGKINGIVDGHADIPPDSKSYSFICYENPLPGGWAIDQQQPSRITSPTDIQVSHVNGVQDHALANLVNQTTGSHGAGSDGSGHLTLTPASTYWRTESLPTTGLKMRVYTNILAGDTTTSGGNVTASIFTAFLTAANSATSGPRASITWGNAGVTGGLVNGIVTGGAVPSGTANIGDDGTFYSEVDFGAANPYNQLGSGGLYSPYYYIFGMDIAPNALTKDYRFRFVLDTY